MSVGTITPGAVQSWVSGLSAAGRSSSRVRQAAHTLRAVMALAVRNRRLVVNPAADVDLPKLTTPRAHRYLSADDLHLLAENAGDSAADLGVSAGHLGLAGVRWPRCGWSASTLCGAGSRSSRR